MNLIEYARTASRDQSPQEFIDMLKNVVPLDEIKNLTEEEGLNFYSAVCWLHDLSVLLVEFHQTDLGKSPAPDGSGMAPCLPGSNGPFIDNMLSRGDSPPDFSQLVTLGLEKYNV